MRGRYVAFEGIDGVGKSTVMEAVAAQLRESGHRVETAREPGGTDVGEAIRDILLHTHDHLEPQAEALLFAAARAQLTRMVVQPALEAGIWVLTDRSLFSSLAYQGGARGLGVEEVRDVNAFAVGAIWPDLVILLEIDPEVGLERESDRDRIGAEGLDFQRAVAAAYSELSHEYGFAHVDASLPFEDVVAEAVRAIEALE
jgi:dTMP kinase